jgi:hypothetical protein
MDAKDAKGLLTAAAIAAIFGAGYALGSLDGSGVVHAEAADAPAQPTQVFELRTYTAAEGRLDPLLARFRDHTLRIFEKHGMTNIGYWRPQDDPEHQNTLVYLIAHPSREAADVNWRAFAADPEWQRVAEESQRDGRLIAGLQRTWLDPTDFSPMK